jgi:hypothetical protein
LIGNRTLILRHTLITSNNRAVQTFVTHPETPQLPNCCKSVDAPVTM